MIILTIEHQKGINQYCLVNDETGEILHKKVRVKWNDENENERVKRELREIAQRMPVKKNK